MNYANPTEIWWPKPSAFDDLVVDIEDEEDGSSVIHLEAPEGTECGEWLAYFAETPERQEVFEREFMNCLRQHIERISNGKNQVQSDEQDQNHSRGEKDCSGAV